MQDYEEENATEQDKRGDPELNVGQDGFEHRAIQVGRLEQVR